MINLLHLRLQISLVVGGGFGDEKPGAEVGHDVRGGKVAMVEVGHVTHVGGRVGEIGVVAFAQVVEHFHGRT